MFYILIHLVRLWRDNSAAKAFCSRTGLYIYLNNCPSAVSSFWPWKGVEKSKLFGNSLNLGVWISKLFLQPVEKLNSLVQFFSGVLVEGGLMESRSSSAMASLCKALACAVPSFWPWKGVEKSKLFENLILSCIHCVVQRKHKACRFSQKNKDQNLRSIQ